MDLEPKVKLRPMEVGDLAAVSELGIRSKASWGYSSEEMAIFAAELTLDEVCLEQFLEAQVAVAEHGELVGYFTTRRHAKGEVELEHLFVEPDWFGRGIGSALFGEALRSAVAERIGQLTIISDPNAAGFYLKRGARVIAQHRSSIEGREIPVLVIDTCQAKSKQPSPGPRA